MANPAPIQTLIPDLQVKTTLFQPGTSGNPNGRPPLPKPLTQAVRQRIDDGAPKEALAIADALLNKAKAGDVIALREVFDRVDGKVPNEVAVSVQGRLITADITELVTAIGAQSQAMLDEIDNVINGEARELPAEETATPQIALPMHDDGQVNGRGGITDG